MLIDVLIASGLTYSGEILSEGFDHGTAATYFLMVYFKVKRTVQASV
jgi:hypothetical protein